MKYKVGDKVKIKYENRIGLVKAVARKAHHPYTVFGRNIPNIRFHANELEMIEEAK